MKTKCESPMTGAKRLLAKFMSDAQGPPKLYPYVDASGKTAYYRVRLNRVTRPKVVRPITLVGTRYELGEIEGSDGKKLLYNLPALMRAKTSLPIYVVEGEPCADALNEIGLIATTSGSATSAEAADWSSLAGHPIVIWADNDEAGKKYAATVAVQLRPLTQSINYIDIDLLGLPDKGDAVDWLKAHPKAKSKDVTELKTLSAVKHQLSVSNDFVIESISMANVKSEPVRWLWPGKIALGKLTIISGDPGLGKSMLTSDLAARVSTGAPWPDGSEGVLGDVLLVSAEDDPSDTIRPRLDTAKADVSRIHYLENVRNVATGEQRFFDLIDVEALGSFLSANGSCRLVVIDPLSAYLGGTDSHKNSDVRSLLAPLSPLAAKHHVAIVVVSHLNKGEGSAMTRTSGSMAFIAAARAAYLVVKDKDDSQRRLFLPIKNNLGKDQTGLAYTIEENAKELPFVCWDKNPVTITADEALIRESESERCEIDSCTDWLLKQLVRGGLKADDVIKAAQAEGYSPRLIRRTREKLGVISTKIGYNQGWLWALPKEPAEGAQGAAPAPRAKKGALGALAAGKNALTPKTRRELIASARTRKQRTHVAPSNMGSGQAKRRQHKTPKWQ